MQIVEQFLKQDANAACITHCVAQVTKALPQEAAQVFPAVINCSTENEKSVAALIQKQNLSPLHVAATTALLAATIRTFIQGIKRTDEGSGLILAKNIPEEVIAPMISALNALMTILASVDTDQKLIYSCSEAVMNYTPPTLGNAKDGPQNPGRFN